MKQRKVERVEKRRPRAELNLGETGRSRGIKPPTTRGCASLLGRLLVVIVFVLVVVPGLR